MRSPGAGPPHRYGIDAVERALELVDTMARLGPATLAQIANAMGSTKTAAFRLLRTLEAKGYAVQTGSRGLWRLSAAWSAVGRAVDSQGAVLVAAQPHMAALTASLRETTYLRLRDGSESEVIAIERPRPPGRTYANLGERRGLHAGPGLLLLAHAPGRLTASLGDRIAELARIRERGWLVNTDTAVGDAVWLTVPVADRLGAIALALSVASPASRMAPPRPAELLTSMVAAARASCGSMYMV